MFDPGEYVITEHTAKVMAQRRVSEEEVRSVLAQPGQSVPGHSGRTVHQSRFSGPDGRVYIIRVVVEEFSAPPEVVTVYRTSQYLRYWRDAE